MHASILTLLLATGVAQCAHPGQPVVVDGAGGTVAVGPGCAPAPCNPYGIWWADPLTLWAGPMPQTCYAPRFGCYPGNDRHMHRYPAFHGYYYRQAYNYRHVFDYPWHAAPHNPPGFFPGR